MTVNSIPVIPLLPMHIVCKGNDANRKFVIDLLSFS